MDLGLVTLTFLMFGVIWDFFRASVNGASFDEFSRLLPEWIRGAGPFQVQRLFSRGET